MGPVSSEVGLFQNATREVGREKRKCIGCAAAVKESGKNKYKCNCACQKVASENFVFGQRRKKMRSDARCTKLDANYVETSS